MHGGTSLFPSLLLGCRQGCSVPLQKEEQPRGRRSDPLGSRQLGSCRSPWVLRAGHTQSPPGRKGGWRSQGYSNVHPVPGFHMVPEKGARAQRALAIRALALPSPIHGSGLI